MNAQEKLVNHLEKITGGPLSSETMELLDELWFEALETGQEAERDIYASNNDPDY